MVHVHACGGKVRLWFGRVFFPRGFPARACLPVVTLFTFGASVKRASATSSFLFLPRTHGKRESMVVAVLRIRPVDLRPWLREHP